MDISDHGNCLDHKWFPWHGSIKDDIASFIQCCHEQWWCCISWELVHLHSPRQSITMLICYGQCSLSRNKTSLQLHAHLRARPYHPGKDYNTGAPASVTHFHLSKSMKQEVKRSSSFNSGKTGSKKWLWETRSCHYTNLARTCPIQIL
jgi:hypothetical protein